jgi:hypothetical protein
VNIKYKTKDCWRFFGNVNVNSSENIANRRGNSSTKETAGTSGDANNSKDAGNVGNTYSIRASTAVGTAETLATPSRRGAISSIGGSNIAETLSMAGKSIAVRHRQH